MNKLMELFRNYNQRHPEYTKFGGGVRIVLFDDVSGHMETRNEDGELYRIPESHFKHIDELITILKEK